MRQKEQEAQQLRQAEEERAYVAAQNAEEVDQRADIEADERAVENAELDIKQKLKVAGRAANEAEQLAREAVYEESLIEKTGDAPSKGKKVQLEKPVNSYKFI